LSVLETGISETTGSTGSSAQLDSHVGLRERQTGESSAGDFLHASLAGVAVDDDVGLGESGVLVERKSIATAAVGGSITGAVGRAGSSLVERSSVDKSVTAVALAAVLDSCVLPAKTTAVSETLGDSHVGGGSRSGSQSSARGSFGDTSGRCSGPAIGEGHLLGGQVWGKAGDSGSLNKQGESTGSTADGGAGSRTGHIALTRGVV